MVTGSGDLTDTGAAEAAGTLDLSLDEIHAAWAIAVGTAMVTVDGDQAGPGDRFGVLGAGRPDEALDLWGAALDTVLGLENLDGLTTALYTAARPVRLDALFEAYAAAVGAMTDSSGTRSPGDPAGSAAAEPDGPPAPAWSRVWSCWPTSVWWSWVRTKTTLTRPA